MNICIICKFEYDDTDSLLCPICNNEEQIKAEKEIEK